jgi:hypothetical protein
MRRRLSAPASVSANRRPPPRLATAMTLSRSGLAARQLGDPFEHNGLLGRRPAPGRPLFSRLQPSFHLGDCHARLRDRRCRGFYVRYLEKLIDQAEAEGRQAPDITPQAYWDTWRWQHGLNAAEAERDER